MKKKTNHRSCNKDIIILIILDINIAKQVSYKWVAIYSIIKNLLT